jgi:hypothetical protein
VSGWVPAWKTTGTDQHTRVMASSLSGLDHACREKVASRARPGLFLDREYDRALAARTVPYRQFALGIVVDAVRAMSENPELVDPDADPLEAAAALVDAQLREGLPAHAGARTWAVHALTSYLEADEYLSDEVPGLVPVGSRAVLYRSAAGEVKEMDVWGLWLRDPSNGTIEVRLLRQKSIGDVLARDRSVVGFVAKIAADGQPYELDRKRYHPFIGVPDPHGAVSRVRVVDIGLADASYAVLFDGTAEAARELYRAEAAPVLPTVLGGGGYNPGRNCDGCYVVEGCPAVPRRPGMLGVVGLATHRRYLTHTRLSHYEICAAQYWLLDEAGVPRAPSESSSASRRGLLVHSALEWLHSRGDLSACGLGDLETSDGESLPQVAVAIDALADEWREVLPYLRSHLAVCPLNTAVDWVRPEPSVVAFDNQADVVLSARPDLLAGVGSTLVWRETKTKAVLPLDDDLALLEQFPQLTLALVLTASGVVGPDGVTPVPAVGLGDTDEVCDAVVELEVLTPTGSQVWSYRTTDTPTLTRARMLLANRVDPWLLDTAFSPQPGPHCHWCPVQEWCRPDFALNADRAAVAMVVDGFRVDPETGEILVAADGSALADAPPEVAAPSARVRSLAESIIGVAATDSDDDLPF